MEYPVYGSAGDTDDETEVLSGVDLGAFFAGRYRIDELVGQGAMGKVFRATDMTNDRPVAVKVLHPEKAVKGSVLERFRREAQILSKVGHHGIVEILAQGQTGDGTDYLVMEYIEGVSLKDHVREAGPMSAEELLPLLIILCDAIGEAHARGVVHRDLKPENVLLYERSGEKRLKVLDFGLSRLETEHRLTKTGHMIGTPRYMAPEQIRSAKDVDERTDIYAAGVLVYEALTGQSPFPAEDAGQLLGCVIENRIVPLVERRPDLPEALGDVVQRAMAKHPEQRFVTMPGFAEAYAAALGRSTGRKHLLETEGFRSSGDALELPEGALDEPRFTRPPGEPIPVAGGTPSAEAPSSKRPLLIAAGFVVALVVVACLATGLAFGVRQLWDRGDAAEALDAFR